MMKICGTIQSGMGKGAFFIQVDWVVKQCKDMLGYKPFPGTLNVRVCDEDLNKLEKFLESIDYILLPDDPAFCTARVKKVMLNDIPAAIVLPGEDVRVHENSVIEIIASMCIKDGLGLEDGDSVMISSI
jgi:riboflavin kinase, archaea type